MQNNNNRADNVRIVSAENTSSKPKSRGHNLLPKILCVVAAFILWLYVMYVESPEYEYIITSVPVQLENDADLQSRAGLTVYSGRGHSVTIKVSGKKSIVSKLKADDINAYMDLSVIDGAGRHPLDVMVDLPEGVSLVNSNPVSIPVYVDEVDKLSLSVTDKKLNYTLEYPYKLGSIELEYDTVTVTGPKKVLANIDSAKIPIDMAGRESSFVTMGSVVLYDKNDSPVDMSYLSLSKSEMEVTVNIYREGEIPVEVGFKHGLLDPSLVKITCEPEVITVRGDASKFADGASLIDKILIDEKKITASSYSVIQQITPTSGVTVASEDREVKIFLELDPALKTKVYNVTDIQLAQRSRLNCEILTDEVQVTLRGTADKLANITADDITLVVDPSGFEPGSSGVITEEAVVVINSESADGVFEIGTYMVEININNDENID